MLRGLRHLQLHDILAQLSALRVPLAGGPPRGQAPGTLPTPALLGHALAHGRVSSPLPRFTWYYPSHVNVSLLF